MNECPICGGDRDNPQPVRDFLSDKEITVNLCNPGGREMVVNGIRVQLADMCCNCDLLKLKREVEVA